MFATLGEKRALLQSSAHLVPMPHVLAERLLEQLEQFFGEHGGVSAQPQTRDDLLLAGYMLRCQCDMVVSQG